VEEKLKNHLVILRNYFSW